MNQKIEVDDLVRPGGNRVESNGLFEELIKVIIIPVFLNEAGKKSGSPMEKSGHHLREYYSLQKA